MSKNALKRARREEQVAPGTTSRISRRTWFAAAAGGAMLVVFGVKRAWSTGSGSEIGVKVTVHKDPNCGCCNKWVAHLRRAGFEVEEHNMPDVTALKQERGVPQGLYSCHTGVAGGYVFEGHVPADLVERVLRERPSFLGLAVPGMPQSAPGMDMGREPYEVMSFTRSGETTVYAVR